MEGSESQDFEPLRSLPFPPLYKSHILHCSYHHWYPKLRAHTPKARLIALSRPFLDYLRSDGIILPPTPKATTSDNDSGIFSAASSDFSDEEDEEDNDPSVAWPEIHTAVTSTIKELGGKVNPKLNWSAPKDATWMSATNDMECRSANDVYLLLKSSDFVTHDLEHAFDDCLEEGNEVDTEIPYHLILRKSFQLNPAVEFRCFVRDRQLLAICQRDQNYFDFLFPMKDDLSDLIESFLLDTLLPVFNDDPNFVFDVYIPPPHNRVWLIDINPWAQRTDPLLFSWLELLTMPLPSKPNSSYSSTVRLSLNNNTSLSTQSESETTPIDAETSSDSEAEDLNTPEFRLIKRDDPEAYQFASTKYSAHKLPKDVVDASLNVGGNGGPGGMSALMEQWKKVINGEISQQDSESSDDEEDEKRDGDTVS